MAILSCEKQRSPRIGTVCLNDVDRNSLIQKRLNSFYVSILRCSMKAMIANPVKAIAIEAIATKHSFRFVCHFPENQSKDSSVTLDKQNSVNPDSMLHAAGLSTDPDNADVEI